MSERKWKPDPIEVAQFLDDLVTVKLYDGDPSLGELARRAKNIERHTSVSTFSRVLAGTLLPTWANVETFLLVCSIDEQEIRAFWKPRWLRLKAGPELPVRPGADAAGHTPPVCPTCSTAMPSTMTPHRKLSVVPA
ncbi:hypothetical protein AB0L41_49045 [Amycolatopsis mediterranei]|uniref:hypothetical protein n=1 Tax=Amycolatopsis mediterranei TaxID=33910 RepID=UPI003423EF19